MSLADIDIAGYRSIRSIRFPLKRLTVLVGGNGVGKTNLYRALELVHKAATGELTMAIAQIAYPNFSLYHATKWGIEGFIESVAQEVAPFGIDFIIAEPGPTGTSFGANLVRPTSMAIYQDTPAGEVRRAIDSGSFDIKGDAARTVKAIIAAADSERPALRLTLGSIAYESVSKALTERLESLQVQRDIALSADRAE